MWHSSPQPFVICVFDLFNNTVDLFIAEEVIEVEQLEEKNNGHKLQKAEVSYATLRTKIKMTQKRKTTFDGRWPLMEDNLWRKTTFDRRRPLTEDDFCQKTTFDRVYSILPEKERHGRMWQRAYRIEPCKWYRLWIGLTDNIAFEHTLEGGD